MRTTTRMCALVGLALSATTPAFAQVLLYDNGPLITTPTGACIPAGSSTSLTQQSLGLTINGFGNAAGLPLADDFVIPASDPGWRITSFTFDAYMSGNSQTSASPFTAVYVRVWDGDPTQASSHVVFGDLTTNRLTSSTFASLYRHGNTCAVTRPQWTNVVNVTLSLPPGTYWLEWQTDGALAGTTGPFVPPVTITGQTNKPGSNAQQAGTPVLDGTIPQDLPFLVRGTVGAPATGACCLPNGSCTQIIAVTCAIQQGAYNGDNSTCGAVTCAQPGACCLADGTCQLLAAFQCAAIDGSVYRGNGVACAAGNCATTGACCQLDGTCALVNEASCKSSNGLFRGLGAACGSANCPGTYPYTGQPVFITDATGTVCGPQVFAEINVTDSFTIASADVSMFVTHTYQGDLQFWLKHLTTGTTVRFVNQPSAGSGTFSVDNYGNASTPGGYFRALDAAADFYRSPPAPSAGIPGAHWQWKPESPLSAFAGENSAGTWQLLAQDCGGGDFGNIESWVLSLHRPSGVACYANCDSSTANPFLNVADFTCFLQKYAAGDAYANCDGSTTAPTLNVADFTCFLQKFAAGCSAP